MLPKSQDDNESVKEKTKISNSRPEFVLKMENNAINNVCVWVVARHDYINNLG